MATLKFTNITTDSFVKESQPGAGRKRKRHRPAVSCVPCRQRKIRCDRELPCEPCQKQDLASSCSYTPQNADADELSRDGQHLWTRSSSTVILPERRPSESPQSDEVRALKAKIDRLEQIIAGTPSTASQSPALSASRVPDFQLLSKQGTLENFLSLSSEVNRMTGILRGERDKNKTRYLGATHWAAVLHEVSCLYARFVYGWLSATAFAQVSRDEKDPRHGPDLSQQPKSLVRAEATAAESNSQFAYSDLEGSIRRPAVSLITLAGTKRL